MKRQLESGAELTVRELEILQLVALGYSAKEVAQEIEIAPRTVECHIDTMRLKMRARNRTHMVAIAVASNVLARRAVEPVVGEDGPRSAAGNPPSSGSGSSVAKLRRSVRDFPNGFTRSSAIPES